MSRVLRARVRRRLLDVDLSLPLDAGPVTVLFGPSGAGKTTLLRCLAGLEPVDDGEVALDGEVWTAPGAPPVPARRRRVGYLAQDPALFPRMTAVENVAYGLRGPRAARVARADEQLGFAGAGHLRDRRARLLSGGEAQRVGLARALAPGPRLLLLDEPLSALDVPTRRDLRAALRGMLVAAAVPTVLVTHDRAEALALGDRVVVLDGGRVRQTGPVVEVFDRPADDATARIVGVETTVSGQVVESGADLVVVRAGPQLLQATASGPPPAVGSRVLACLRAEDVVLLGPDALGAASPRNRWSGTVVEVHDDGPLLRVRVDCGFPVTASVTRPAGVELGLRPGAAVVVVVKAPAVHLVPAP